MFNTLGTSIGFYCLFAIFVFQQQRHIKSFRGESQSFFLALSVSAFTGTVTGLIYIGYYGWLTSWWEAAVVFVFGILASGILSSIVERLIGSLALSIGGFVGWPICAYLMFNALPSGF
jgi:hypothetical protein